jgi:CRP-like cAMP-binding protein
MTGNVAFAGNLSFLNLGELLQLLGTTGASGILQINSQYASQPGLVYIEKGNPINAAAGSKTDLDALYSLFGWKDGEFEFIKEDVSCEKAITQSRMEIILDGLRLLDEGRIEVLGASDAAEKLPDTTDNIGELPLIKGPLVDYTYVVDEESFYDGDEIVQEGNHGNWIWVILEGVVQILKETPKGKLDLLKIGDGAFLGSVASLIKGDNVRSASITAVGNVQLGMLDSQLMTSELANLSTEYRNFVNGIDFRLKQATKATVDIYSGNKQISEPIKGKKAIIKQGQDEKRLFQIRSGEACIAREINGGLVPLAHLREGDFFGRVPFLDMGQEPYSASVFASQGLKLAALDPAELQREHDGLSATLQNIFTHLATCISVTSLIACDYYKKASA